ncbi:DEKNAAC105477 [Brettanomyces naardenensis]|uniref:Mevalonate kinase n=1 Tax=Brettanomyces naardenensis TaxID=13370 RepID=A0A448YTG9_BRENA|nr:DEKNAAC105477 [Brettanomyces naardenensis]
MTVQFPFVTSAPGKVIIFGEHSAVYNRPAIAAALSLRTYLLVTKNDSDSEYISLEFPDINFRCRWKKTDLPFHTVSVNDAQHPQPPEELDPEMVNDLGPLLSAIDSPLHYGAAYAFLYLLVSLCSRSVPGGLTFAMRSTLPIGAGLGSSASMSVCLAAAFGYIGGHVKEATVCRDSKIAHDSEECTFIDQWAFMGEKCIHGNPSGIDNAVATHGGAVMFQRMGNSLPSVRTAMRNLPPMKLLLTNTKTPRRTATLVAGVSKLVTDYPKSTAHILDAMEAIAREAYNMMLRPFLDEEAKRKLLKMIRINHGLLVSLGVSHPNLERIKLYCDELSIGETKLTGAGGGGCAITLLRDNVKPEVFEKLNKEFAAHGFESFRATLGGKGAGILISNDETILERLTVENFINFRSRDEIEESVGCSEVEDWRYW